MKFDVKELRNILGHYPTGVCVITGMTPDHAPAGMVVGSFTSVSLDPPLVGFFPDRNSRSWSQIQPSGRFCVNILAHDQRWLCRRFASKLDKKFEDVSYKLSEAGLPLLDGVVACIDCTIHAVHEAGDHFIVLGEVQGFSTNQDAGPLIFCQGGYGQFTSLSMSSDA